MKLVMCLFWVCLSFLHAASHAEPPHYLFFSEGVVIGALHSVKVKSGGVSIKIGDLDMKFESTEERLLEVLRGKIGAQISIGFGKSDFDNGPPRIIEIDPAAKHYCPDDFDNGVPSTDTWRDRIHSAAASVLFKNIKIALVERHVGPIDTTLTVIPMGRSSKDDRLSEVSQGDLYYCLKQIALTQKQLSLGVVDPFIGNRYINVLQIDPFK